MMSRKTVRVFWCVDGEPGDACPRFRAYVYRECFSVRNLRVIYSNPDHFHHKRVRSIAAALAEKTPFPGGLQKSLSKTLTELLYGPLKIFHKGLLFVRIASASHIIFQRRAPGAATRGLLRLLRKKCFFDLDDALYLEPPSQSESMAILPRENQKATDAMKALFRICFGVIVANDYLKSWVMKFHPRVIVIPTSCPVNAQAPALRRQMKPQGPVLGWTGAVENQRYLMEIMPVLEKIVARFPGLVVRVLTRKHWIYPFPFVQCLEWEPETAERHIRDFTAGLAPLPDSGWTRGKMQFKALQYMAQAVPVVASPIGMDARLFRDGENVLLAENAAEWERKLLALLGSKELQQRIGEQGHRTVAQHYSSESNGAKMIEFITG